MRESPRTERELLEHARQHEEPAFAELVEIYTPLIFRIVRRMMADSMEAESIVQETFWRFWQALPRYDAERPLLPYLATIASNLARDRHRRERRLEDLTIEDVLEGNTEEGDEDTERELDDERKLLRLAELVQALPFAYRSVITLRYDADMSYAQIAEALSLPINTIRTHLRRAKQLLRRQLEEAEDG